jgi:hypothetical protein
MKSVVALLVVAVSAIQPVAAQVPGMAGTWRAFAEKVEVGSAVKVRLQEGPPFTATLVQARPDALVLQPKTRTPVPVQAVSYESIVSIERVRGGGIGPGKAAAIGVATGVAGFLATLLIFVAAIGD